MFKTLVIPVNLEETQHSRSAMQKAVEVAQRDNAELHVITVLPGFGMPIVATYFPKDAMQQAKKQVAERLNEYIAGNVPAAVTVHAKVLEGKPADSIVAYAQSIAADLIVLPPHDRPTLEQVALGSCTAKVAQHAHCSVMVVRG